ncbi:DUF6876 family protein [Limnohabitans sp. 63ED37-2]|uniref:DUF6876 family protein n=1 Tax=Limnohabitans sp. 63ED37-2 TaxID=1678128 RepID=UPI0009E6B40C|nr:DUF6876 family protein [Limnohabitans sp. 63ED37-2]
MVEENELLATLKQFTGSEQFARLTRTVVLTEGARYLAETVECFWLFDLYASHLSGVDCNKDWFTCLKLTRTNRSASVSIEDGNDRVLAKQNIEYTDFPLPAITLYGCWAGEFWVLMLTSEY